MNSRAAHHPGESTRRTAPECPCETRWRGHLLPASPSAAAWANSL